MKKIKNLIVITLAFVLIFAAVAVPQSNTQAASPLMRLVIENNSSHFVSLRLSGPTNYYMSASAGSTSSYTPERGEYSYTLYSCGIFVHGEIDLTKHMVTYEVPPCGSKAYSGPGPTTVIDAGKELRLVKVTLKNETGHNIVIVFSGTSSLAFFFYDGDSKDYTIPKGDYTYEIYGCGAVRYGTMYAHVNKVKELTCPTW
jgi:hypothetical protein